MTDNQELVVKGGKCTPMQKIFCESYVGPAKFDRVEAARIANYAQPRKRASALFKNHEVLDYIEELMQPHIQQVMDSCSKVVREVEAIAFTKITDILDLDDDGNLILKSGRLSDLPETVQAAIKAVTVHEVQPTQYTPKGVKPIITKKYKIELHSKTEMLKLLTLINRLVQHPDGSADAVASFNGLTIVGPSK